MRLVLGSSTVAALGCENGGLQLTTMISKRSGVEIRQSGSGKEVTGEMILDEPLSRMAFTQLSPPTDFTSYDFRSTFTGV
jgi:hypothetical protein